MLKCNHLKTSGEFQEFSTNFCKLSGNRVDHDYLAEGLTRGFYNSKGQMVGGFAIKKGPNLRYADWIPAESPERLQFNDTLAGEATEWTCIWLQPNAATTFERILFYVVGFIDCIFSGSKYLIGGSNNEKVKNYQMKIFPDIVYSGKYSVDASKTCWLYKATKSQFALNAIKAIIIEPFRVMRQRKPKRDRQHNRKTIPSRKGKSA